MPNIVPGVIWQPIAVGARAKRRKGRGLCGHVAVSSSKNLVPGPNADWHFYLPKQGPAIQYIDLDLQCRATGAGNTSMAAFESEGGLGSVAQVNAEPWTDNQLNWAARILRHMADTEGVPLRVMASSATAERGFGTHRLGVPGYMVAGTEQWSSSRGKLCPGDAKHAQRHEIVRRAAAGANTEEDDMFDDTDRKDLRELKTAITWALVPENGFNSQGETSKRVRDIHGLLIGQNSAITGLAKLVAEQNGLSIADVRRVVAEEVAKGVDVDVTVTPGQPAA